MRPIDADKLKIPSEEIIAKMAIAHAPSIEPNLILPERMERGDIYEVGETIVVMNHDDYYDLLCKSWEPKRGEWIPCSERLPSGEDAVLVSTCAFDAIYDVVFMMAKDVERFYECGYVNAWMPSPEPWEGADDESINFK